MLSGPYAGIAQLVEHRICNPRVAGSNPAAGTIVPSPPGKPNSSGAQPLHAEKQWTIPVPQAILAKFFNWTQRRATLLPPIPSLS